jgi:hypothetical protein
VGSLTTSDEIQRAVEVIAQAVRKLNRINPST